MSKESNSTSSASIGFSGLLTIAFIVLKLCNVIAWSWIWVLSPLWAPLALVGIAFAIVCVVQTIREQWKDETLENLDKLKARAQSEFIDNTDFSDINYPGVKKSKFMQKLDEAIAESEKRRKVNEN